MGKYSVYKGQMTNFTTLPDHQDKVNNVKANILDELRLQGKPISFSGIGNVLIQARLRKAELEADLKAENLVIEAMTQELVERLEAEHYDSLRMDNGVSLTIKDDVYCSVEDRIAFYRWIKETNQTELFTVNYQTMSALTKNLLVENKPIPPGVGAYFKQSITVRGLKGLSDVEE